MTSSNGDEELAKSIQILLRHPLLLARSQGDDFATVKRNADRVQKWFQRSAGYQMRVDTEIIRLYKGPTPAPDPTHPALTRHELPFNAHRYAVLCLALAALEREESQIDLASLADRIQLAAAADPALKRIDLANRDERKVIVDVVRLLTDWAVVTLRDGDETSFLDRQGGNALYDIHKDVIHLLIASPVAPSLSETPAALRDEPYPATEEGRQQRTRHKLMRRLLEEPVVYREELDYDELDDLDHHQQAIANRLREAGLHPEIRNEGIAALDPTWTLAGHTRFPGEGTVPQAALLLADLLTDIARSRQTNFVTAQEVVMIIEQLKKRFGEHWRQEFTTEQGTARLADLAAAVLVDFKFLQRVPDGYRIQPAIARFAAGYNVLRIPRGGSP